MVVANIESGASHLVGPYFENLAKLRTARGECGDLTVLSDKVVGLVGAHGDSGLDNGFNLLETAFAPIDGEHAGLSGIHAEIVLELTDAQAALEQEGATILNAAEHPDCPLDDDWYRRARAPRPIYIELVDHRGWRHHLGIDAKAQNSPCTAIGVNDAVNAVNAVIALGPASIALFANSPLECGVFSGHQENRMTLWTRMFQETRFAGDFTLQQCPAAPFVDLRDYFNWMFGPTTATRSLPSHQDKSYKSGARLFLEGDPSLVAFLQAGSWAARNETGVCTTLHAHAGHFVEAQFAQFLDARWRYRLNSTPDLSTLLRAWNQDGGLEALFAQHGVDGYIEGRAPGANFADPDLMDEAGPAICASVAVAPSAIQLGLMRNLGSALDLVRDWGWENLSKLRAQAITHAVSHDQVHALARDVVAIARHGLAPEDAHWLAYPEYVLATRRTGATRLLDLWQQPQRTPAQRLAYVAQRRRALAI